MIALYSIAESDQKIREEALGPTQSFIVQAPAGSGKTGLLIQRFLKLLSCAERVPEECIALTFTRKAAAEMRDRILQALRRAQDPIPPTDPYAHSIWVLAQAVLKRDQQLDWQILDNPNRLKIQTIDALCAALARQMPVVSQFGSMPRIVEDPMSLYQLAARNLLKALESNEPWSAAIATVLAHLDNNLALTERLLAEMLSHRDQWLPYVGQTFSISETALRVHLESGLERVLCESLDALIASIPSGFSDIIPLAKSAAIELESLDSTSPIIQCKYLADTWPGSEKEHLPLWLGLAELLLTREHTWRKTLTVQQGFPAPSSAGSKAERLCLQTLKAQMQDCLSKLEPYSLFQENLGRLRECPPRTYDKAQWHMVAALLKILPVLTAELSLVFQEKGEVDFSEILLAALRALGDSGNPSDLALALDYKIRHILVDEFQDTSLSQFRLLEKLSIGWQAGDGRTLFLVGDPMQSIYRFRQAEVGLFLRVQQQGVGDIVLKALKLSTNFRSDPQLVEWSNRRFESIFPPQDDITTSAIRFHPSIAAQAEDLSASVLEQSVTLETEPGVVVDLIQDLQERYPGTSIAVLVRSRSHLQHLLPSLHSAHIAYQGIHLEKQGDRVVVQDLLSLTRALLHVGDRIAWLAIFRTPWAFLNLSDLWRITHQELDLPLWHSVQRYMEIEGLSEAAQACLARVVPILSQALLNAQRLPLRIWVMETWLALGGLANNRITLYPDRSLEDAEAFFRVLEELEERVWEDIGILEQRLQSLFADSTSPNPNAVQIMTLHKAKGLEFDTVILPGMGRKTLNDSARLLLWEERIARVGKNYFLLAPIKAVGQESDRIYAYLKQQERQRMVFESTRLEYVAATRARRRIYCLTHNS